MISVDQVCAALGAEQEHLEALIITIEDGDAYIIRERRGHTIYVPRMWWSTVGKELHRFLKTRIAYQPPHFVYGFVKGGSTLENARNHLDKDCVLRIDIKKFFPSIRDDRIIRNLQVHGFASDAATLVARLVCVNGGLAIGVSASPLLSNLVMAETDEAIGALALDNNLVFTRYVDDLVFSGSLATREDGDAFADKVRAELATHGWTVNETKTAFMRRGGPQYVTGLYVGDSSRPHVPRDLKRSLRWIARMIEAVGYETYMRDFSGEDLGHYRRHLLGLARYIASIDGRVGSGLLTRLEEVIPEYDAGEDDADYYGYLEDFDF